MRIPLTVATGVLLVAGVVVGVTAAQASTDDVTTVAPIRVEAPAVPVPAVDAVPVPAPAAEPVPVAPEAAQPAAPQQAPRDPNGYVAPPPASDDDDDDDGGFGDDDADDDGDD